MNTKLITLLAFIGMLSSCQFKSRDVGDSDGGFDEKYRPQYHFTPPGQWMNDPNGMVYYEGEYHLFYQHYPDSNVWGPMHWGHAVSTNMINWEHLPIALYPDSLGYIFSGSAVIDWKNSSGLGSEENPPMVAIFTYHDPIGEKKGNIDFQTQGIAFSLDKGRTWTKYENNPVLSNPGIRDFRDPKVSWFEEFNKWIMILAVKDHVEIYSSDDLIKWQKESEFGQNIGAHGGVWECPDLFQLTDNKGVKRWVMLVSINPGGPQGGSATQYFIGGFNGKSFTPEDSLTRWIDYGADNYAGVTWSNVPENDGRRLFLGWMSNWQYSQVVPTYKWRSAMTLPRELTLKNGRLYSYPVLEFNAKIEVGENLTQDKYVLEDITFGLSMDVETVQPFELTFNSSSDDVLKVGFNGEQFYLDRTNAGIDSFHPDFAAIHFAPKTMSDRLKVELFVDTSSIEIFINGGEIVITDLIFPISPYNELTLSGVKPQDTKYFRIKL